jgi:2',3'-cyclic-nucleotide 2'-phosphodiesterase (5'-nucleotidase family)
MTGFAAGLRRAILTAGFLAGFGAASAEEAKLTFVLTNDIYQMSEEHGRGGMARLAGVVKAEKAKGGAVLFVHAGDTWSPCLLCGFDQGAHMVALLNEVPPDVFVPGNHEFDFGKEVYFRRRAEAKFPFFAANLRGPEGQPLPDHQDRTIIDVKGVRIGVVGLALDTTPGISSPGDLKFLSALETLKAQAAALRGEGADLVVAVTHTDRVTDFAITDQRLADILLTGHDHDLRLIYDGRALMAESGSDAEYVIAIDLDIAVKAEGGRRRTSWHPNFRIIDTATATPDPAVAAKVAAYEAELSKELDIPLGNTAVELDSRTGSMRSAETAFGALVADALRSSTGADVAITNGGGIRGNRLYPAGATLTRRDILTEMPFGNTTVMTELAGADLRAALEHGLSAFPGGGGHFPQISGMTVEADRSKPPGSRLVSVLIGSEPLNPARRYKVATNDFLLRGGDGYIALTRGKPLIGGTDGKLMAGEVMAYIRKLGTVSVPEAGRIVMR